MNDAASSSRLDSQNDSARSILSEIQVQLYLNPIDPVNRNPPRSRKRFRLLRVSRGAKRRTEKKMYFGSRKWTLRRFFDIPTSCRGVRVAFLEGNHPSPDKLSRSAYPLPPFPQELEASVRGAGRLIPRTLARDLAARGVSRRDGEIDPAILATCA